jgi:hypothetical protein
MVEATCEATIMSTRDTILRGRRLIVARAAWALMALIVLGLDVVSIPSAYDSYRRICTRDEALCQEADLLTPQQAQQLHAVGLSPEFYAGYRVAQETLFTLVCFAVALVIFLRRSDEPMALFTAFVLLLFGGAGAGGTMHSLWEAHPAFWFPIKLLDYLSQVSFGVLFYVFPNGRFVPAWTRLLAVAAAVLFVPEIFFPDSQLAARAFPFFIVFVASLAPAQIYRYRRVSTPIERQQTKWIVFSVSAALAGFLAVLVAANAVSITNAASAVGVLISSTLIYGFLALIPLGIGMAILRSGLWAIDTLINRTLVYGTLTTLLAALYWGSVVVLQRVLTPFIGTLNDLAIVASTLLIATLFQPLRNRIQRTIDRRFYRRRYDSAQTLAAFSNKLRDEVDLQHLSRDLIHVVADTLQPAHVGLWLRFGTRTEAKERS